jgi:hypothetical protein
MQLDEYKHAYYYSLKLKSREKVVESLNSKIKLYGGRNIWDKLTICSINKKAIEYARLEWPKYYGTNTHLGFEVSWERLHYNYANNPSSFNLAVWQAVEGKDVLQGLALGRPSDGKRNLNINWIERSFAPNYFKGGILLPILACAEEYAKLLGSERVVIGNVIDTEPFEKYGYALIEGANGLKLVKEIESCLS